MPLPRSADSASIECSVRAVNGQSSPSLKRATRSVAAFIEAPQEVRVGIGLGTTWQMQVIS